MAYGSIVYSRRHRKPTGPRRLIAGDDLRRRDRDRDRGPDRSARFIWTDEPNKVQLFRGEIDRELQDNGYAELITLLEVEQGSANRSDAPAQERRLLMRGPGQHRQAKSPTFEPGPGDRWHALTLEAYLRCSRFWTTRNLGYTGKLAGILLLNCILKRTKSSLKLRVWHFENFLCIFFRTCSSIVQTTNSHTYHYCFGSKYKRNTLTDG